MVGADFISLYANPLIQRLNSFHRFELFISGVLRLPIAQGCAGMIQGMDDGNQRKSPPPLLEASEDVAPNADPIGAQQVHPTLTHVIHENASHQIAIIVGDQTPFLAVALNDGLPAVLHARINNPVLICHVMTGIRIPALSAWAWDMMRWVGGMITNAPLFSFLLMAIIAFIITGFTVFIASTQR
uniref:Uncharacterized protein n=1 Tax=Plectus sambesii TaxID=2011161 RepID=A0A914WKZ0_9BILA